MNKVVKKVSILLIAVMLVTTLSQVALATDPSTAISEFSGGSGYQSSDISGVKTIAQKVLTAIRNLSIIIAVIMISVLGIKYMVGSAEEKAGYKKAFIPLIVGAILVVSAASLATMLFSLKA